ncbi:DegT/DnrJ/EryC1/StrS family aminotransferase [Roseococcus sp. YIM B11640]|uniref:DegT/DnrJ/EryC1/StrS family aminotransferase n=1 Tax=Roseococcus sp. YIM B11640 TaxID=3133973 RepID=UPI003C7DD1CE
MAHLQPITEHAAQILPFRRSSAPRPEPLALSPPQFEGTEIEFLRQELASGWLAPAGPTPRRFEAALSAAMDQPHAVAVNSGTAALHLGYHLLGVQPGDEVWTSTLTFVATVAPAVQMGATPRFLDVDPQSWTLDPALLRQELAAAARRGRLPRVVVPVDLYGQAADMPAIRAACGEWGVPVLSDSACGLGALQHGRPAGHGADLVAVSFNGNKIVSTGGGGALLGPGEARIARARQLATQAREPAPHYQHETTGYNYAMSCVLAAIGLAQLPSLERRVAARRAIFARYREELAALPGLTFMPEPGWARATRWLTAAQIDPARFGAGREALRQALEAEGIESRPVWKPLHLQPAFRDAPRAGGEVAAGFFERGLCLPSGSGMSSEAQFRAVATLRALHRG